MKINKLHLAAWLVIVGAIIVHVCSQSIQTESEADFSTSCMNERVKREKKMDFETRKQQAERDIELLEYNELLRTRENLDMQIRIVRQERQQIQQSITRNRHDLQFLRGMERNLREIRRMMGYD